MTKTFSNQATIFRLDPEAVSIEDVQRFKRFYTDLLEFAGDDISIDSETKKFLLYLYLSKENTEDPQYKYDYDNFDVPKSVDEQREYLKGILEEREKIEARKQSASQNDNNDSTDK